MSLRILGLVVFAVGVWLLSSFGWAWWSGYVPVVVGLVMAAYVRKVEIDEEKRQIVTTTGFWPLVTTHTHTAQELRSIKLTVNHRAAKNSETPLNARPIFRSTLVFGNGRWARLMSGRKLQWIEKRTYSVASALGLNVETTDSYDRYRDQIIGKE
jgi:hypothetical protein